MHYGPYYASQTFDNSPDGRKIQIGWVQVQAPGPYNQHFSFPHCPTLHTTEDGIRMFAKPVKEIETLRVKSNKAEVILARALMPVVGKIELQVLVDRSMMEIAGNDGRVFISGKGPGNKVDVDKLSVTATGGDAKLVQFEAHELKSIG